MYTNSTQTIASTDRGVFNHLNKWLSKLFKQFQFTQQGDFTMERTITTGYMSTALGTFKITKTIEEISTEDYMSMILSNRDIINSEDVIKDLFFDKSSNQLFRVIK